MAFEPNHGQTDASVRFTARGEGYGLYLTSNEAVLALSKPQSQARQSTDPAVVRMKLVGSDPSPRAAGLEPLPGKSNYFLGNDPSRWKRDVPQFGKVRYDAVYPGVDLVYYGNQNRLEYDFVVAPKADPNAIRLSYSGVDRLALGQDGSLELHTGGDLVRQDKPVVYQVREGRKHSIEGDYVLLADNQVTFRLGAYDRSQELVIDPVVNYSTYFGGSGDEFTTDVVVDGDGNPYITGLTLSTDFPVVGAPGGTGNSTGYDAFVIKLNSAGSGVVFSTYFGGTGEENRDGTGANYGGLAIDASRNVYVTGYTTSTNIPVVQPIQINNAGNGDAFVFKLNPAGNTLLWSTYLGGRGQDGASGIALDATGSSYVVGRTTSTDFNLKNAYQGSHGDNGTNFDAFLTRINSEGTGLVYSTYLGGLGEDRGNAIAVDPVGNVALTGITRATNFPITAGAFQPDNQGSTDAFVSKFNPVASQLVYSSYLGGSGENTGTGIALDDSGNAYVTGYTTSTDFPTTTGAFDETWNGGISDGFVAKINSTGTTKLYCSYLGGDGEDIVNRVAVSVRGNNSFLAYVTGSTSSSNFPVEQAIRTSPFGGIDAFVTKFNVGGNGLEYSTYYGGAGDDAGTGIAVDGLGRAYVVGRTTSANFPLILPMDNSLGGTSDSFIARLISPPAAPGDLVAIALSPTEVDLSWSDNSDNEVDFVLERRTLDEAFVELAAGIGANTNTFLDAPVTPNTTYIYRIRSRNAVGGSAFSNAVQVMTPPLPPSTPTNVTVTAVSQSELRVEWTDTSDNEAEFRVERSLDNSVFAEVGTVPAVAGTGSTVSFLNTGLATFTTYYYRVYGINAGGAGAASDPAVFGTTLDNPPAPPSDLLAMAIQGRQVGLTWILNSTNETEVWVQRSDDGAPFTDIVSLAPGTEQYIDSGLQPEALYTYRVYAVNSGGPSGFSNEASAFTFPDPPAAPTNLTLTVLSQTAIQLDWTDESDAEEGFRIERSPDGAAFAEVATIGSVAASGSPVSYTDGTLEANTTYYYRIIAFNLGGDSAPTSVENAITLPNPPTAPSLLLIVARTQTSLTLRWVDNANNEDGFVVEWSLNGSAFTPLTPNLNANTEQFVHTGLMPATTYFYRVKAFNTGGASAYTPQRSETTLPLAPSAPAGLTASLSNPTEITLNWTDQSDNETGFQIERSTDGTNFAQVVEVNANIKTYTDVGLANDTQYFYRVRATNGGGNSGYSNTASAITVPAAPASLSTTALSSSSVRLLWSDTSTTETNFRVERKTAGQPFAPIVSNLPPNTETYEDTGLTGNTSYTYRVYALSAAGDSNPSNEATALTLPNPPTAPSNLQAVAVSQTQINLNWSDNSDNESSFRVERSSSQDGPFFELTSVQPGVTFYEDKALSLNTTAYYRIFAVNSGGASNASNIATATTFPAAPSGPTGLTATPTSESSIVLNWVDSANNEDGFKVEQAVDGVTYNEIFVGVLPNQNSYTATGLQANTRYHFRVRAYNQGGHSGYSNSANALTLPAAPFGLTAEAISTGDIRLNWNVSRGADGFEVEVRVDGTNSTFGQIAILGAGATSYTHTDLLANNTFEYRVRSFNRSGSSVYSNTASATTQVTLQSLTLTNKKGVPLATPRTKGGRPVWGVVTLNGPAPKGGLSVSVTDNHKIVTLPKAVRVPAGETSVRFLIRTRRTRSSILVTITASAGGASRSAQLTVNR